MSGWPEEKVGPLIDLWNEGKSGSQIALYFSDGTSRSAVIGKLYRLGLARVRRTDAGTWNRPYVSRLPPSPPRSFSWELRA